MEDLPAEFFRRDVPQPISTELAVYGGVFTKLHVIPKAGTFVPQHAHGYDHQSLMVVSGGFVVWCNGVWMGEFGPGQVVRIPAGALHTSRPWPMGRASPAFIRVDLFEETEEHQMPGELVPGPGLVDDGIVFAQEPFTQEFIDEAAPLLKVQFQLLGDRAKDFANVNYPLLLGCAQQGNTLQHHGPPGAGTGVGRVSVGLGVPEYLRCGLP